MSAITGLTPELISQLPVQSQARLIHLMRGMLNRKGQSLFYKLFPEVDTIWDGPPLMGGLVAPGQIIHSRDKYSKHLEFFAAGAEARERCFMAANRVGKTFSGGGYEVAAHLTGQYPDWWEGRRFAHPISAWVAGDTYESTRDIIQLTLLGEMSYKGSRKSLDGRGVVPGDCLGKMTWRSGVQDLVDRIKIKHITGGWSSLAFKSYDQGRKAFQGTGRHVIWADEEPPADVYGEMLIRTATLNGICLLTFTPLSGLSEVVLSFLPKEMRPDNGDDL